MSDAILVGEGAAICASLERGLIDLERRFGTTDTGDHRVVDRMPSMARTTKTAAGQNAETSLGGSQIQTALDRGDYETQDQAVAAQAEETRRKPEDDSDPRGNQVGSINYNYDDKKYTLARRMAAIRTIEEWAPEVAAKLQKRAEGEMGEPLGGMPPSVEQGQDAVATGEPSADPAADAGAPPMDAAPVSDPLQNLQEIARQRAEDVAEKERELASSKEVLKEVQDVLQQANAPMDLADGKEARRKAAAKPAVPAKPAAPVKKQIRTAAEGVTMDKPGGGEQTADKFSMGDAGQYGGAHDADDALHAESKQAKDKPVEGESRSAEKNNTSQRNAGDYPITGAKLAAEDVNWSTYDRIVPARTAKVEEVKSVPTQRKTATEQDLQPQAPTGQHGTYDAADTGDTGKDKDLDAGTTPVLESSETKSVTDDANRELDQRSRETMRGSVTGSKEPIFNPEVREKLKVECKRIDDAYDHLRERVAMSSKHLVRGQEIAKMTSVRLATLKRCGDAIEAALKTENADRDKVIEATKRVVALGRSQMVEAQREGMYLEAALIEAKRAHDREARTAPSFALAVHQVQHGMLGVDELPAKVAEYVAMDAQTFETVAKTVEEVGARARQAARSAGLGNKTAVRRLPTVPEESVFRSKDDLQGIFE